jgi:hypothetical protein
MDPGVTQNVADGQLKAWTSSVLMYPGTVWGADQDPPFHTTVSAFVADCDASSMQNEVEAQETVPSARGARGPAARRAAESDAEGLEPATM